MQQRQNLERQAQLERERAEHERQESERRRREDGRKLWSEKEREIDREYVATATRLKDGLEQRARNMTKARHLADEQRRKTAADRQADVVADDGNVDRREDELRDFSREFDGDIWNTLQDLRAKVELQDAELENARASHEERGVDPLRDPDFVKARNARNALVRMLCRLEDELEDAFLVAQRLKATPGEKELEAALGRARENGLREAKRVKSFYQGLEARR